MIGNKEKVNTAMREKEGNMNKASYFSTEHGQLDCKVFSLITTLQGLAACVWRGVHTFTSFRAAGKDLFCEVS